jgi:uncharacterized membrane protein
MASQKQGGRSQGAAGGSRSTKPGSAARGQGAGAARSGRTSGTGTGAARAGKPSAPGQGPAAGGNRRAGAAPVRPAAARNASTAGRNGAARGATASSVTARPATPARFGWLLGPIRPFLAMTKLQLATLLLSLIGLGVSIYLTIAHFDTKVVLLCAAKGIVNCEEVTTSPESVVFGIFPVAVLGLAFYVFMTAINSPWAWRWQQRGPAWLEAMVRRARLGSLDATIRWVRLGSLIVGMGFVLYLVYAELIQIGAICLWCTSVHVTTFLLFSLIVFNASFSWTKSESGRPG